MKTTFRSVPLVCAMFAGAAFAPAAMAQDALSEFSISGNATIVNDYRFRGYTQTNFKPAIQLGFDVEHSSGFYLGNWNSNVSDDLFPDGNLEMDFYGGWKGALGDSGVGIDVGVLYYYYPGSDANKINPEKSGPINNTDLYLGLDYDTGRYGSYGLKYSYTPSDFFKAEDTKGTWYLAAEAAYDLGDGWGLNAHLGYQKLKNTVNREGDSLGHYVDYQLGVTKDIQGWTLGLAAVGATKDNWYATNKGKDGGRLGVLFSVSKAF
ncbi:TorF family putative porin [Corticimicrobacter populi]|uniref:Porin n=1 Tax=Corticimicrobacter populi TaxID=2175229 RepID=A0A2V1JY51_9BURK|nr:TorF family putative porin [Corticimicrobacter populi]PWF23814.1 hypothetical protein DD235_05575 [Corticimicrobacter populi]QDQ88349.1 hypothetical protein FMZ60_12630 [Alcaligenaceae bacterium SJ-26]